MHHDKHSEEHKSCKCGNNADKHTCDREGCRCKDGEAVGSCCNGSGYCACAGEHLDEGEK